MPDHFHALDIPFLLFPSKYHLYKMLPMPRLIQYSYTPTFTVHFPEDKRGANLHDCLNLRASESESKRKLCGYLHNVLYFSTISLRLTITNLLLRSPFSSFSLENQTVEFTIQFSHECSTSPCWHQIIFMLRTFHFLSFPSKNFHIDLKDFESLLYIQLKFSRNKFH